MKIECIEELGAHVGQRWQSAEYDPARFPEIATHALREAALTDRLTPEEILQWGLRARTLPQQQDPAAKFGQPPLTLFTGRNFYIGALFWVDGTTTIHQHAFSGAFLVLAGSSIETRYAFDVERSFDGHFVFGTLRVIAAELRGRGDISPIHSGPAGLIHALFHMERPSVTIVIRTIQDANAGPQFDYLRPGIGVDPFHFNEARDRALQLVALLQRMEHPMQEQLIGDLIARSDSHSAYRVLNECAAIPDRALFGRLVDRVQDRSVAAYFREALLEKRRLAFLTKRRAVVKDPDLRFFLGVLLNAPRREDALALVRARVPSADPATQIAAWLRRLSTVNEKVQVGGVPWEPNLFGLPDINDLVESALAQELSGAGSRVDTDAAAALGKLRNMPFLACLYR